MLDGEGQVQGSGGLLAGNHRPVPLSPEDELARLAKHYGREKRDDGSAGDNWAGIAYGRGDTGVREIERLMREAIVDLPPAADESKGKAAKGNSTPEDARQSHMEKVLKEWGINKGLWLTEMRIK
jgi:hypothetical protein